ncbi:uncharacterized protein [Typha latifolia]|uniref:uncharacterized protein isoform X1 n=2 Tax=Typha latifolia TaxID=4733 RepID=UPI003C2C28DF
MAGRRDYGCSSTASLLLNEGISSEGLEGLFVPGVDSAGFQGSRSMMSFEDIYGSRITQPNQFLEWEENAEDVLDECLHQPEKKRRLTGDQLQFLERSFEIDNKLDPERKIQLARDLGLQPRQIAIWFQNRRARWKTKQLEKEYDTLKCSYNALKADYDNLLTEKEHLKAEVLTFVNKLGANAKSKECSGSFKASHRMPNSDISMISKDKELSDSHVVCKQEDLSPVDCTVFDFGSPHDTNYQCNDKGQSTLFDSSNAFEAAISDTSLAEEDEDIKKYNLLDLEGNSCGYEFLAEDQALWFSP